MAETLNLLVVLTLAWLSGFVIGTARTKKKHAKDQ